jgi:hypothetical protein
MRDFVAAGRDPEFLRDDKEITRTFDGTVADGLVDYATRRDSTA